MIDDGIFVNGQVISGERTVCFAVDVERRFRRVDGPVEQAVDINGIRVVIDN